MLIVFIQVLCSSSFWGSRDSLLLSIFCLFPVLFVSWAVFIICCVSTKTIVMDGDVTGGLINSISRFIHLVACQTTKSASLKDFRKIVGILKLLRPVVDQVFDPKLPFDEHLMKELEELDVAVNEARELVEKGPQRMSKIYTVSAFCVLCFFFSSSVVCSVCLYPFPSHHFSSIMMLVILFDLFGCSNAICVSFRVFS